MPWIVLMGILMVLGCSGKETKVLKNQIQSAPAILWESHWIRVERMDLTIDSQRPAWKIRGKLLQNQQQIIASGESILSTSLLPKNKGEFQWILPWKPTELSKPDFQVDADSIHIIHLEFLHLSSQETSSIVLEGKIPRLAKLSLQKKFKNSLSN